MEGKRVAAAAALCCMLIFLSGQQQVNGLSEFCGCYGRCYPGCKESHPGWLCTMECVEYCTIVSNKVPAATIGAGDCSKICLTSVCGEAETGEGPTDAGAAPVCVHDCFKNWSRYKNKHT